MKIYMGADHRGLEILEHLRDLLETIGHEVDLTCPQEGITCDYPDTAYPAGFSVTM